MYRIELVPGEVTVFRTVEELATGVRNGLITPKARIYHSASDKWLPIEFHPHYKQALELASGRHSAPSASKQSSTKPAERPRSEGLTFLNVPVSPTTPTSFPASGHSPAPASPAPQAPQPAPGADSPGRSRAVPEPVQLPWTMPAPDTSAHATGEFVPSAPPKRDPVEPASPYAPPIAPAAGDYATATRTDRLERVP